MPYVKSLKIAESLILKKQQEFCRNKFGVRAFFKENPETCCDIIQVLNKFKKHGLSLKNDTVIVSRNGVKKTLKTGIVQVFNTESKSIKKAVRKLAIDNNMQSNKLDFLANGFSNNFFKPLGNIIGSFVSMDAKHTVIHSRLSGKNNSIIIFSKNSPKKNSNFFSTKEKLHEIVHEFIHCLDGKNLRQKNGSYSVASFFDYQIIHDNKNFNERLNKRTSDFDKIKEMLGIAGKNIDWKAYSKLTKEVGIYAFTNPQEFIAEVGTAKLFGKKLPKKILAAYDFIEGPDLKSGIFKMKKNN